MGDVITGWFAYILSNNSGTTFIFLGVLVYITGLLWWMQTRKDSFDIRDIICTWDSTKKKQVIDTSKSLLAGSFIVSSYYIIEHPSDMAFGVYIAAWVTNSGIKSWQKTQIQKPSTESVIK